ncbi:MAG: DUF374 domain-containing protein [Candidatus Neomarinimicrobiota bacterium]
MSKQKKRSNRFSFWLSVVVGGWLIRLIYRTNRMHVQGAENYLTALAAGKPVIVAIWHGRLLGPFMYLAGKGYYGLSGTHKDAELITRIGLKIGWNFLRGSSTERGREAYQEMLRILRRPGVLLYITPDGPKGPAKVPKAGAIRAAQATGAVVIPVASHSTRFRGFTNWDTFVVAKAFARTEIIFGSPIIFPKDQPFEECAHLLTAELNQLEQQVDELTGN